jgi:hypothetical protein
MVLMYRTTELEKGYTSKTGTYPMLIESKKTCIEKMQGVNEIAGDQFFSY